MATETWYKSGIHPRGSWARASGGEVRAQGLRCLTSILHRYVDAEMRKYGNAIMRKVVYAEIRVSASTE